MPADSSSENSAALDITDHSPEAERFTWPPAPVHCPATQTPLDRSPDQADAGASGLGLLFRTAVRVERALAIPTIEPIRRQATDLAWCRDGAADYCARCGRTVGPAEEDEFGCSRCRGTILAYDRTVRLGEYAQPLDQWVWALKFQRLRRFGEFLGRQLADALREAGADRNPPAGGVIVQPLPTSRRRRIVRGIDHARVLAAACAVRLDIPMVHVLSRGHRPSQRAVPTSARWDHVRGSITVRARARHRITASRVILVDDVLTTGATARTAALALRGQPDARYAPAPWAAAEVWFASVARAE